MNRRSILQCLAARREGLKLLGLAALLNAILFGLFLACATPYYETNDDLGMQMIASGFFTGHPSEHLVFTNVLIGWALRILYGSWSGWNWYMTYLVAVHYAALTVFAFLLLSRRPRWSLVLVYVVFFLMVEVRLLLNLQFTTTAFLAGTAGVLLLVDGCRPDAALRWPKVIAGLVFASVMFLIREPVAPLLAIVASPFLIERFGWAGWRRLAVAGLLCTSLFVALHGLNHWYYQRDPEWAEYLQYNQLHGAIRTSPLKRSISQAAPSVGWSENDAWMFANWYFSDPDVFGSASRMRLLVERLKAIPRARPFSWREFTVCLNLPRVLGPDAGMLMKLALLVALGCLCVAGAQRRRCFGALLATYGLFVLLAFYLRETSHLPERVSYNLPLFIHVICLYWAGGFEELPAIVLRPGAFVGSLRTFLAAKPARLATLFLVPVWVVVFASSLLTWARALSSENGWNCYLKEEISHKIFTQVKTLMPHGGKPFIIPVCFESPLEQCLVFSSSADKANFWLLPYSWLAHSPVFRESLAQHRLQPFSLSLLDRADVFFQMKAEWIEPLGTFYREHYGLEICFHLAMNTDELPQCRDCQLHLYQAHVVPGLALATDSGVQSGGDKHASQAKRTPGMAP